MIHKSVVQKWFTASQFFPVFSLFKQLSAREVLVKYKGSFIGGGWLLIEPLFMLTIYTIFFGYILKSRWPGVDVESSPFLFSITLFLGLIIYNFLSDSVIRSTTLLQSHLHLFEKVKFPMWILPIVNLSVPVVSFTISLVIWAIVLILSGHDIPIYNCLRFTFLLAILLVFTLGMNYLISALSAYFKDLKQIMQFLLLAMMFGSPIFYSLDLLSPTMQDFVRLNPLTFFIEESRGLLIFDVKSQLSMYFKAMSMAVFTLVIGLLIYCRVQKGFVDVL